MNSSIAICTFVKTPGFSPLKTRLGKSIGKNNAEFFHIKSAKIMSSHYGQLKRDFKSIDTYWAIAEEEAQNHSLWMNHQKVFQGSGGLAERLNFVFQQLWSNYDQVIFVGNDSPQILYSSLKEFILRSMDYDFSLWPTLDGGFFSLSAKLSISNQIWHSVPYSQNDTAEKMIHELQKLGQINIYEPTYDIDLISDLELLARTETHFKGFSNLQIELVEWSKKIVSSININSIK